jgi:hypothetical protein
MLVMNFKCYNDNRITVHLTTNDNYAEDMGMFTYSSSILTTNISIPSNLGKFIKYDVIKI